MCPLRNSNLHPSGSWQTLYHWTMLPTNVFSDHFGLIEKAPFCYFTIFLLIYIQATIIFPVLTFASQQKLGQPALIASLIMTYHIFVAS